MKFQKPIIFFLLLAGTGGLCLEGNAKARKTVDANEVLQKGREAFLNYNFEEASDLYDQYRSLKTKAKQPLDDDFELWETELEIASNAFDRVQKIVVVDSIEIPASKFYEAYKLASSSGIFKPYSDFDSDASGNNEIAFINEGEDLIIFPKEDVEGNLRLFERQLLLDGNWEENESLNGNFDKSGDYAYPFLGSDGVTLYFANNGEESMGGYDLFVAQKDPLTGEYLQPLNLGMPFNSPYDDIMMAIDEENGLGWWATNRNSYGNTVTVYVYQYSDMRKNYPSDTENLENYAKLASYKHTWVNDNGDVVKPVMPKIENSTNEKKEVKKDFEFNLGNGQVYYKYSDFRNRKAGDMMKQYLGKVRELEKKEELLSDMRLKYKSGKISGNEILKTEEDVDDLRSNVRNLRSEIIRLEKSVR